MLTLKNLKHEYPLNTTSAFTAADLAKKGQIPFFAIKRGARRGWNKFDIPFLSVDVKGFSPSSTPDDGTTTSYLYR